MTTIQIPYGWAPRSYQMPIWNFLENGGKRAAIVWHRRAGKDLFSVNWCAREAFRRVGLYWHLFPTYNQGRKIVWDGFTKDGRPFLDHFPAPLVAKKNNTEMKLEMMNGSIYQVVGTDNVDRLVGANPIGCIFSEYSLQDPAAWDLIRPMLAENGGWAVFIYTPRGRNHGWDLLENAKKNPRWFSQVLDIHTTKAIDEEIVNEERLAGMPEELIQQEFYCSFDAALVGSYYGPQMEKALNEQRIGKVPWEPRLPVHTAWDLGVGDATAIWFIQVYGHEVRVIDYYENSGEGLPHYAKVLAEKEYMYGDHYAPHDIEVREFTSGKARIDVARQLGIRFKVVKQHSVEDGIEAVRNLIPSCWFDAERCKRGLEALRQYRKEWDEKKRVFRDRPLHDWTSHPADALRIFAMGRRERPKYNRPPQYTTGDYDPFSR